MALDYFQITPVWDIPAIESLLNNLLPSQDQPYLQQFVDNFVEILHYTPLFTDIFAGLAPFTNAPLKKLASPGSSFFDQVYAQLASLLKIHTTTKQNLVAPNDAFVEIYDQVMHSFPQTVLFTNIETSTSVDTGIIKEIVLSRYHLS